MVSLGVREVLRNDDFVLKSLETQRNQATSIMSLTFLILGMIFVVINIIFLQNNADTLILGLLVTIHGSISFSLMRSNKSLIGRLYFLIGFSALVYGSAVNWGGLLSFAYPATFSILILSTVLFGLMGLFIASFFNILLITVFLFLSLSNFYSTDELFREFNIVEYYIIQLLVTLFVMVLLILNRFSHNSLLFETKIVKDRLEQIMKNSPDGIILLDKDWNIIEVNDQVERITGYSKNELIGYPILNFTQPQTIREFLEYKERLTTDKGDQSFQSSYLTRTNKTIYFDLRGTKLEDGNTLHILRDLTKEKEKEIEIAKMKEKLAENQKIDVVRKISGNVAHDFNNLLAAVIGYAEVGEMISQDPETDDIFDRIRQSASRGKTITRRLLSFTRVNIDKPVYFEIDEEILGLQNMLRNIVGSSIDIIFDLKATHKGIFMDRSDFEQVIVNIIMNSKDVSIEGDSITISTRHNDLINPLNLPKHTIKGESESIIELIITDTGGGMIGNVEDIFTPFYSTKEHGTGLGLNIVFNIIEKNDGYIGVNSNEEGLSIVIYLPTASTVIADHLEDKSKKVDISPMRILIVEDEESVRTTLGKILRTKGHDVTYISNGQEAINLLEVTSYDFIISDIIMPHVDGYQLLSWIERNGNVSQTPILFMTGFSSLLDYSDLSLKRMNIIEKPFTINQLEERINELMEETIDDQIDDKIDDKIK